MTPHGKLIVFEGPDGSGKTTLSNATADTLTKRGVEFVHLAFPGRKGGTLGKHVYRLHHEPQSSGITSLTATSLQVLHIAAHVDAIESVILPALRSGKSVILDRFWWSTWVYGVIGGANREALRAMIDLELVIWDIVKPSVVFLIRRQSPIGARTNARWANLSDEYTRLAIMEEGRYPIQIIENGGNVESSISTIVTTLFHKPATNSPKLLSAQDTQFRLSFEHSANKPLLEATGPTIFTKLTPAKTTVVFDTYWRFAAERQAIFFRRMNGAPPPWTHDSVLLKHKFTNAYRASDRVSQYLIKHVIYNGDQSAEEVFFRILLFKIFNRIETWELLVKKMANVSFADYSFKKYDSLLTSAIDSGRRIYSAAYIMPSGGRNSSFGRKHRMHLDLIERMIKDELPIRLVNASSMSRAFDLLLSYPTIGDFLAYQFVTDLNYSNLTNFTEMEFVVAGPGAQEGIQKSFSDFGGLNESDIIKLVTERQNEEFDRLGLKFQNLWGRPLQLIDCQNIFCEVGKYARIVHPEFTGLTGRIRIKQKFRATVKPIEYWYPPKWGLNGLIAKV